MNVIALIAINLVSSRNQNHLDWSKNHPNNKIKADDRGAILPFLLLPSKIQKIGQLLRPFLGQMGRSGWQNIKGLLYKKIRMMILPY